MIASFFHKSLSTAMFERKLS